MIDPVVFGEVKGAVFSLQSQVDSLRREQSEIDKKLDRVLDKLSEARGGWRVLLMFGGAATTIGAGLAWLASYFGTLKAPL